MLDKLKSLRKNHFFATIVIILLIITIIVAICMICNRSGEDTLVLEDIKDIEITEAEMKQYRERIGGDMDIKKAYLILFEDEESCRSFIDAHGDDQNPTVAGIGIVPMMENGYYNIVGKQALEDAFDSMDDGEYSREPVIYSDMYCFLKRIGVESPIDNDEELKELIRNEKYQRIKKDGD